MSPPGSTPSAQLIRHPHKRLFVDRDMQVLAVTTLTLPGRATLAGTTKLMPGDVAAGPMQKFCTASANSGRASPGP